MDIGYISPESLVTFSEIQSQSNEDLICFHDSESEHNITIALPVYRYGFDPDLYRESGFSLPRNILRTISEANVEGSRDISVQYHMPHWKHFAFTPAEQKEFIMHHFPDRMSMYKKCTREQERIHLFIYLWLYMNGGVYIGSTYELMKPFDPIFETIARADLYFVRDFDRYPSTEFLASQPFCEFWLEVVDRMKQHIQDKYDSSQEEIDRNTGRRLLSDVLDKTQHKYEFIPQTQLGLYSVCNTNYVKDLYLRSMEYVQNLVTYVASQTDTSTEAVYIAGTAIVILTLMFIIALITN